MALSISVTGRPRGCSKPRKGQTRADPLSMLPPHAAYQCTPYDRADFQHQAGHMQSVLDQTADRDGSDVAGGRNGLRQGKADVDQR